MHNEGFLLVLQRRKRKPRKRNHNISEHIFGDFVVNSVEPGVKNHDKDKAKKPNNKNKNYYKALDIDEDDFDIEDEEDTNGLMITAIEEKRPRTSSKDKATQNVRSIKGDNINNSSNSTKEKEDQRNGGAIKNNNRRHPQNGPTASQQRDPGSISSYWNLPHTCNKSGAINLPLDTPFWKKPEIYPGQTDHHKN
jgi:hypothetical protein